MTVARVVKWQRECGLDFGLILRTQEYFVERDEETTSVFRGSAGDLPAPVGDPPTGIAESNLGKRPSLLGWNRCSHTVRRAAGRHRRVGCATKNDFSNRLL